MDGISYLHLAAGEGFTQVLSLLLARCAQISFANKNGETPLELIIKNGHQVIVAELLRAAENSKNFSRGEC